MKLFVLRGCIIFYLERLRNYFDPRGCMIFFLVLRGYMILFVPRGCMIFFVLRGRIFFVVVVRGCVIFFVRRGGVIFLSQDVKDFWGLFERFKGCFMDVLGCFGTVWDVLVQFGIIWDALGQVRTFCYVLVHIGGAFEMF